MANESGAPADFRGVTVGTRDAVAGEAARSMEVVTGGSMMEAVDGIAAVILSIIGLLGILPFLMAAIATIVTGVALLSEGGAIAARYSRLLREVVGGTMSSAEIGGGMTAEILGGIAAIVLGILALLHIAPWTLMACALIVIGASVLLSSGTTSRLSSLTLLNSDIHESARRAAREAVVAAAGAGVLVGLAAIVLGILALIGIEQVTLILVGFLAIGVSLLLSGAAISGKMMAGLHH